MSGILDRRWQQTCCDDFDIDFKKELTVFVKKGAYDENKSLIFPLETNIPAWSLKNYSTIEGDTCLYPAEDINEIGYDGGQFYSTYNFCPG